MFALFKLAGTRIICKLPYWFMPIWHSHSESENQFISSEKSYWLIEYEAHALEVWTR